jgi:Protein of unknown function (DUF2510)
MTTPPPPAGWYPNPSGGPGQMYWDGERWQTGVPAQPPPAAAPTPWGNVGPYLDKARPHVDKGRRFWSGLPGQRKIMFAVAGLLIVVAVGAVFVVGTNYLFGGGSSTVDTSSQSYRMGLKSGTDGPAEIQAFGPWMGAAEPYDQACQQSYNTESGAAPDLHLNHQDYMGGCLYGLSHQGAQWTRTRKTSPNAP